MLSGAQLGITVTALLVGYVAERQERAQLALVADTAGQVVGIAALEDLLEELIGEFDDETDNT
jgi:CBS domain containing-hemolysin-like protein